MSSAIEICNKTLCELKCATIASLDDQLSAEAKMCKLFYAAAVAYVLSQADWSFAMKETRLSSPAGATPLRYAYAYELPPDCVRPCFIWNSAAKQRATARWEVVGPQLHIDLSVVELVYVSTAVNEAYFTPAFEECCVNYLAAKLAIPLKGDAVGTPLQASFLGAYQFALANAVAHIESAFGSLAEIPPLPHIESAFGSFAELQPLPNCWWERF